MALPLIRIICRISYEVTFGDPSSICKKRTLSLLNETFLKGNGTKQILTNEWTLCCIKNKNRDQGRCVPCLMLAKQDLTLDLKICALSQSLTHCMNFFDSSSFSYVFFNIYLFRASCIPGTMLYTVSLGKLFHLYLRYYLNSRTVSACYRTIN